MINALSETTSLKEMLSFAKDDLDKAYMKLQHQKLMALNKKLIESEAKCLALNIEVLRLRGNVSKPEYEALRTPHPSA